MTSKKPMTLDELAKAMRRNYFNQWRKNNPERVKQHSAAYWQRKAMKEQQKEAALNDTKTDD